MGDIFKVIDDYTDMLCKRLQHIVDDGSLSNQDLEIGEIISETLKDFEKYRMMVYAGDNIDDYQDYYRDGNYNGYHGRYPDYMYQGNDGDHQTPGENYNRGYNGYRNVSRGSNRGSRGYNNYGHTPEEMNEHIIKELERTMDILPNEQAREPIRQRIQQLRSQTN